MEQLDASSPCVSSRANETPSSCRWSGGGGRPASSSRVGKTSKLESTRV